MELMRNGWFAEENDDLWPGQCFSLKIKKVLHHEKSKYQDILIVETQNHGRALILDGIIQCTQHDEFSYQEMISMLPLCAHPAPEKVLIVGGGDGGVAREVVKHPRVQKVHQVEIDERVVELSKQFLPWMGCGFNSEKMELHIEDGFQYLKNNKTEFDVIITDSSDPVGPNSSLFQDEYFQLLFDALKPGGIVCCQGGAPWLTLPPIRSHMDACRRHFPLVKYAVTSIPTYPTGQIGFVIGCKDQNNDITQPRETKITNLRYYTPEVHKSSFVLPAFVQKGLFE